MQNQITEGPAELKGVPFLVMDGTFNGIPALILKDDVCTANVVSQDFAGTNHQQLKFSPVLVDPNHFMQGANEIATQMSANGTIRIGTYSYTGNWIVADCRYDVLLGMPWHMEEHSNADYVERSMLV